MDSEICGIVEKIYRVVSLCGGASDNKHKMLRDRVRVLLETLWNNHR